MTENNDIFHKDAKTVTFGASISFIILSENPQKNDNFLLFPSFLTNKLELHDFQLNSLIKSEFSFALFQIYPLNDSNYKYQSLLKRDFIDNEEKFKNLGFYLFFLRGILKDFFKFSNKREKNEDYGLFCESRDGIRDELGIFWENEWIASLL